MPLTGLAGITGRNPWAQIFLPNRQLFNIAAIDKVFRDIILHGWWIHCGTRMLAFKPQLDVNQHNPKSLP